uniref:Uncharacterized protein n=1 Tax=Fagus sylvatica TaxID=28930 RepID=A0A2N9G277_FAGSY
MVIIVLTDELCLIWNLGDAGATPVDAGATPVEVEVGVSQPESACTQQAGGSTPVKPSHPLNSTTRPTNPLNRPARQNFSTDG